MVEAVATSDLIVKKEALIDAWNANPIPAFDDVDSSKPQNIKDWARRREDVIFDRINVLGNIFPTVLADAVTLVSLEYGAEISSRKIVSSAGKRRELHVHIRQGLIEKGNVLMSSYSTGTEQALGGIFLSSLSQIRELRNSGAI